MLGTIALSGIIMRNSVILVDQIEQDIAAGARAVGRDRRRDGAPLPADRADGGRRGAGDDPAGAQRLLRADGGGDDGRHRRRDRADAACSCRRSTPPGSACGRPGADARAGLPAGRPPGPAGSRRGRCAVRMRCLRRQEPIMTLAPTPEIVAELKAGRMVVLVDEEDRENEGDLVLAAEFVTPEAINFMAHARARPRLPHAHRGALPAARAAADGERTTARARHQLHRVDRGGRRRHHRHLGRRPRAHGPRRRSRRTRSPRDIVHPGHIFPVMAQPGGVLVRAGHTEAGCDLARLAGLTPAAVICEIMKDDGTMARLPDLVDVRRDARPQDRHDRRPDPLPQPDRAAGRARRRAPDRDAARRVPAGRLPRQALRRDAPRAGARADLAGRRRRWCACTSRCR